MDVRTMHGRLRHHGAVPGDSKTLQRLDEDLRAAEKVRAHSRHPSPGHPEKRILEPKRLL